MPNYRLTGQFELEGTQPAGFSESWDFVAADDDAALQMPSSWEKERVRILANNWTLSGMRLAQLVGSGSPGGCVLHQLAVEANVCRPPAPGTQDDADSPYAAVYVTINTRQSNPSSGEPPRPRRWLVRGIPDAWWDQAQLQRNGPLVGAINRYLNWMIQNMQAGTTRQALGCTTLHFLRYSSWCIKRVASRRVGRPFDLLRGRRGFRCPPGQQRVVTCEAAAIS